MIRLEMKNCNIMLREKQQNYHEYFTGEEILPPGKKRVIEQAKFRYSPLCFLNQNKRLATLPNKDDDKGNYK